MVHSADELYVDRRREARLEANTPVTVTVLGILGEPVSYGLVVDMSASGLRISLLSPLPCGAAVTVRGGQVLVRAEVTRCAAVTGGYIVGLELAEVHTRS